METKATDASKDASGPLAAARVTQRGESTPGAGAGPDVAGAKPAGVKATASSASATSALPTIPGPASARPAGMPASGQPGSRPPASGQTASRAAIPRPVGTYVADSFTGDIAATMGGTFALAQDGELAGLARVTMAMREPVRKEAPAPRRLVGLACWAALLGILGSILAIRDGIGVMIGAPAWFFPTSAIIGIVGIALTMGAFVTARARIVPWTLLGLATCALLGAFIATLLAF